MYQKFLQRKLITLKNTSKLNRYLKSADVNL